MLVLVVRLYWIDLIVIVFETRCFDEDLFRKTSETSLASDMGDLGGRSALLEGPCEEWLLVPPLMSQLRGGEPARNQQCIAARGAEHRVEHL